MVTVRYAHHTSFLSTILSLLLLGTMPFSAQAHDDDTAHHHHVLQIAQADNTTNNASNSDAAAGDTTIVRINGEAFSIDDLRNNMSRILSQPGANLQQLYPMLLEQFILERLLSQTALAQGYADDSRVQQELQRALEMIANNFFVSDFLERQITEDMLSDSYAAHIAALPEAYEVQASHILLETEEEAKAVIATLEDGADFATLAQEKSIGPSASNGGDLGYFSQGQMVPAFEAAAFALSVGDFSRQPVKTQFGYHVIQVNDNRSKPHPTLEEMRDQLHQELSEQQVEAMIAELTSSANIERFDLQGNPIDAPQ